MRELVIRGALVVTAEDEPVRADIEVRDGVITRIGADMTPAATSTVVDAGGLVAYPGAVDAHQHWGIYASLDEDTVTESRAAAQGGVTTGLSYLRSGQYYLNKS